MTFHLLGDALVCALLVVSSIFEDFAVDGMGCLGRFTNRPLIVRVSSVRGEEARPALIASVCEVVLRQGAQKDAGKCFCLFQRYMAFRVAGCVVRYLGRHALGL